MGYNGPMVGVVLPKTPTPGEWVSGPSPGTFLQFYPIFSGCASPFRKKISKAAGFGDNAIRKVLFG